MKKISQTTFYRTLYTFVNHFPATRPPARIVTLGR